MQLVYCIFDWDGYCHKPGCYLEVSLNYKYYYCQIFDDDYDDDDCDEDDDNDDAMTKMIMGLTANHSNLFSDLCSLLPQDLRI